MNTRTAADVEEAMKFDFPGWGKPGGRAELDRLCLDGDFYGDLRDLLIEFRDPDFDIARFLMDADSDRLTDLRRAHAVLVALAAEHPELPGFYPGIDDLSKLAMEHSLCPIHFIDWAICFDDELEDCAQVRAIFPNHHDT